MVARKPLTGEIIVTGRLFVEYELSAMSGRRLTGWFSTANYSLRKLYFLPIRKRLQVGPPIKQELRALETERLSVDAFPLPVLGAAWRRPTGFLLTIALSE